MSNDTIDLKTQWQNTLVAAAQSVELVLQQCNACQTVQYPPAELCSHCLSEELNWKAQDQHGQVLAFSKLQHRHNPQLKDDLPWLLVSIQLDCGPIVFARWQGNSPEHSQRVKLFCEAQAVGNILLTAQPISGKQQ